MIDLDDLLAPLAEADLGGPTPVKALAARAAIRARRRHSVIGASVAAAVFVVVAVALLAPGRSDDPARLETAGPVAPQPGSDDPNATDVTASTPVQPVVGGLPVGRFPYDAAVNGNDLWVLNQTSNDVTRIDATTQEVRSTIALPANTRSASTDRLVVHDGGVWVAGVSSSTGTPGAVARIDIATEALTVMDTAVAPLSIASDGDRLWVAGMIPSSDIGQPLRPGLAVMEADGVPGDVVELATGGLPVDVAATADRLWVLLQAPGPSLLIEVDPGTGAVVGQLEIEAFAVRLVATDDELVVGTDTSGGGGRTGALTIVDPGSRTITASAALDARPEAIVVIDDLIVTSGLRAVDRRTLEPRPLPVEAEGLGFVLSRFGADLWATVPTDPDGSSQVRPVPIDELTAPSPGD